MHSSQGHVEFPRKITERLANIFETIPVGQYYTKDLQASVLSALKDYGEKKELSPSISAALLEAMNSADLDWRLPKLKIHEVEEGEKSVIDFEGVARLNFDGVTKGGTCRLTIKPGLPSLAEGMIPGWPVVTYQIDFDGSLSKDGYVVINFYMGGTKFTRGTIPMLLQWDGKNFKNITSNLDQRRGVISGRTKTISSFVILGAKSDIIEKEQSTKKK
ncbi:MAG: hypothetical protein ACXADD_20140 [Candidatus Thorarchaeota archaeon]